MFRRFSAIAKTTFAETLAEPVSALLLLAAILVVHLAPVMQFTQLSEPGRLARDGGFSAILVFGLFFSVSAALRAVGRELSSGTAAAALARPVPRPLFLAGKTAGVLSALFLFSAATLAATALSEGSCIRGAVDAARRGDFGAARVSGPCLAAGIAAAFAALLAAAALHGFRRARFAPAFFRALAVFQIAAALGMAFSGMAPVDTRIFPVAVPVVAFAAVLAVAAAALACRLRAAAAAAGAAALFAASAFVSLLPRGLSVAAGAAVPDLRNFWLADALSYTGAVPWRYAVSSCGSAAALIAFWFAIGCVLIRSRDVN